MTETTSTIKDAPFNHGAMGLAILITGLFIAMLGSFRPITDYLFSIYHIELTGWIIMGGASMFFAGCVLVLLYGVNLK